MIRAEIKFKNASFITALNKCGYNSIQHFSRESGIRYTHLIRYANLEMIFDNTHHNNSDIIVTDFTETKKLIMKLLREDEWTLFEQYRDVVGDKSQSKKIITDIPVDKIVSLQNRDILKLEAFNPTDETLINDSLKTDMSDILNSLKARERDILKLLFGIGYDKEHTLDEIAEMYGLTRERVGQIRDKSFRRIKHWTRSDKLVGYIGLKKSGNYYDEDGNVVWTNGITTVKKGDIEK